MLYFVIPKSVPTLWKLEPAALSPIFKLTAISTLIPRQTRQSLFGPEI